MAAYPRPWRLLAAWSLGSLCVTALLRVATWFMAVNALPDLTRHSYPGLTRPATTEDFFFVLRRNVIRRLVDRQPPRCLG